jgi:hypothetical protein
MSSGPRAGRTIVRRCGPDDSDAVRTADDPADFATRLAEIDTDAAESTSDAE